MNISEITAATELLTPKETAAYLRIPGPTVYYLLQHGMLPAIQIGGRWRVKRSLLDRDILKIDDTAECALLVSAHGPMRDAFESAARALKLAFQTHSREFPALQAAANFTAIFYDPLGDPENFFREAKERWPSARLHLIYRGGDLQLTEPASLVPPTQDAEVWQKTFRALGLVRTALPKRLGKSQEPKEARAFRFRPRDILPAAADEAQP